MDFLRFLEGIRTPVATAIFSFLTYFGDELFFMVLAITVFWCVSKRYGYFILAVGFLGTVLNQFMKLWFRVPRPWVLDPEFTIVESARAAAGGYSFPSGHTQNAVGTMACVLLTTKRRAIRIAAVALMVLVPFSRMYLGCHTPLDVFVAFVLAWAIALALLPIFRRAGERPVLLDRLLFGMLLVMVLYWLFITFYRFPAGIDQENLYEGSKNAYTLLGCLVGLLIARFLDERYIHFEVKAVWWAQILKVLIGLALLLAVKEGLKIPLQAVLPVFPATAIRYGLMVLFAGAVWPLTFPFFSRLGRRDAK